MKKTFIAVLTLCASLTFAQAQTSTEATTTTTTVATKETQEEKVKIKPEDLPEAVKKSLDSEDYRGWLISAAYEIKSKNQFEVELKNGAETKTLVIDKDGKKVD